MDLFSPSGHREVLDLHPLNLIQGMFVPLEGEEIGEGNRSCLSVQDKREYNGKMKPSNSLDKSTSLCPP